MNPRPVGIFDSGIGGLTVVKDILRLLPNENIIYLGDTARVPYGTRGKETITEFALQLTHFLLQKDVKILVVACNTISATCLEEIERISPVPVIGVIKPAADEIVKSTQTGKVGVIGTQATINSSAYEHEIHLLQSEIEVISKACPLFVPIVEEGLSSSDIARQTAKYYLNDLADIDVLHLGCTHYPLLKDVIREVLGNTVKIIDSASPTAMELKRMLEKNNALHTDTSHPITQHYYFTDNPERVLRIVNLFLEKDIKNDISKINVVS